MYSSPSRNVLATLVIVLAAVLSSAEAGASQPYPFEGARRHLYVADAGGHVYLYPFLRNGLPSSTPDATLAVGLGAFGLAFDSQNELYVTSQNQTQVNIFAPGPHGATKLIKTYNFSRVGLESIEVDPQDFVYLNVLPIKSYTLIKIYPPGIGNRSEPLAQIRIAGAVEYTIDRTGALYVRTDGSPDLAVYSHPLISQMPDGMIAPSKGYEVYGAYGGIAVDRSDELIYTVFSGNPGPWAAADFDIHELDAPLAPDRLILTRDCAGEFNYPGLGNGAAIRGRFLFYACGGEILVYRADRFGRQPAVLRIGGGQPTNLIVGL